MTRTMTVPSNKLKLKIIKMKPELSTCEIVKPGLSKYSKGTSLYGSQKSISVGSGDNKQLESIIGEKRGAEGIIDLHMKKKLKMDRHLYRKCFVIMKKLMTHQCSWPFLQPVDPISLKIPDYFSRISRPMDLGTVKSKLENNLYTVAEDFSADVRLIFSNAMRYNPPSNKYHHMAKEMDKLFSYQWRLVDSFADKQHIFDDMRKKLQDNERGCLRIASGRSEPLYMKPIVLTQNNEGKSSKDMSCKKVQAQDIKHDVKISKASKMSNSKPVSQCSKSSLHVECDAANPTCVNSTHKGSTRCTERMKPRMTTVALTGEEMPPIYDAQLSPEKALRAAMLKRRFAGTILKAQQQTARPPGETFEAVRLNGGEMRLGRKQQEEKCKIQTQIKNSHDRKESECRILQRQREREAARKSLQKMQRTVEFDDNISTLTELAHIIGDFSFAGPLGGYGAMYAPSNLFVNGRLKNPLERLGLYLKKEDAGLMDCEEGELIV